ALGKFLQRRIPGILVVKDAARSDDLSILSPVFARQKAAGKRTPRHDGNPRLHCKRNVLALQIARDQGVFQLEQREPLEPAELGERLSARRIPRRSVAKTDGAHHASFRFRRRSTYPPCRKNSHLPRGRDRKSRAPLSCPRPNRKSSRRGRAAKP